MVPNNLQFNHINRSISNISKEINTLGIKFDEFINRQDKKPKRVEEREHRIIEIILSQDERAKRAEERQEQRDIAVGNILNRLNGNIIRLTKYSINNISNFSSRIYGLLPNNSLNSLSNGYSGNNYHSIF